MLTYVNLTSGWLAMPCARDVHISTQDDVIGGQRRNRVPVQETWLGFCIGKPDLYDRVSYGRGHVVPVQLFWVNSLGAARRALLYKRGNREESFSRPTARQVRKLHLCCTGYIRNAYHGCMI